MSYEKFNSVLYETKKPFHKMSLRELCDYNKVVVELDKMPIDKIKRLEKWSEEKRQRKIKKFLNKKINNKTKKINNKTKKMKMMMILKYLKKRTKQHTKKLKLNKKYFTIKLIK